MDEVITQLNDVNKSLIAWKLTSPPEKLEQLISKICLLEKATYQLVVSFWNDVKEHHDPNKEKEINSIISKVHSKMFECLKNTLLVQKTGQIVISANLICNTGRIMEKLLSWSRHEKSWENGKISLETIYN